MWIWGCWTSGFRHYGVDYLGTTSGLEAQLLCSALGAGKASADGAANSRQASTGALLLSRFPSCFLVFGVVFGRIANSATLSFRL